MSVPRQYLRDLRRESGLSQEKLCEQLFMTQANYSRLERGATVKLPGTTAHQLANIYKINIYTLMEQEKEYLDKRTEMPW